jgi:hypothetical protein
MDVTRLLSEFRSELERVERDISFLEFLERVNAGTGESAAQPAARTRRIRKRGCVFPNHSSFGRNCHLRRSQPYRLYQMG